MLQSEGYVTTEDGARLYFQKSGSGEKTVVVPNGFYLFDDFKHLADRRTVIVYDLRNRGLSDPVTDASKLKREIHHDVAQRMSDAVWELAGIACDRMSGANRGAGPAFSGLPR